MDDLVLNLITDDALREQIGPMRMNQGLASLAAGFVIDRVYNPQGKLTARWDLQRSSPAMEVQVFGRDISMYCTCKEFSRQQEFGCRHLDALFLAWIHERNSFTVQRAVLEDADFTADQDWYDEDEEDVLEGLEEIFPGMLEETASRKQRAVSRPADQPQYDPVQEHRRLLSSLALGEIRELARRRGVPVSGNRKDPIVDTLAEAISRPGKLAEDWPRLSLDARRLLSVLISYNRQQLGTEIIYKEAGKSARIEDKNALQMAVDELAQFGLIFVSTYGTIQYHSLLPFWIPPDRELAFLYPGDTLYLTVQAAAQPRTLLNQCVRLLLILTEDQKVIARPDQGSRRGPLSFLASWNLDHSDLERITRERNPYNAVRQHRPRVRPQASQLLDTSLQKLAQSLSEAPEKVDWMVRLLHRISALELKPEKRVRIQADNVVPSLLEDPLNSAKLLFAHYASLENWMDIDLVMGSRGKLVLRLINDNYYYERLTSQMSLLRHFVMTALYRQPADEWIGIDGLVSFAYRLPVQKELQNLDNFLAFELAGKTLKLRQEEGWKQLFQIFLEAVITGPLYWQGLVDLGWEGDRLVAFRLTGFGGAVLNQTSTYSEPGLSADQPALLFSPEGKILVRLETVSGALIQLLALLGSPQVQGIDQIAYTLQLESVSRAFEAGWTLEQILDTLQSAAGSKPVPESITGPLRRWWENFGLVQLYSNVAMIELGDDYALNELLAGTSLAKYLLYRFNSRLVAIRPEGVEALREEMLKKGYTPRMLSKA